MYKTYQKEVVGTPSTITEYLYLDLRSKHKFLKDLCGFKVNVKLMDAPSGRIADYEYLCKVILREEGGEPMVTIKLIEDGGLKANFYNYTLEKWVEKFE